MSWELLLLLACPLMMLFCMKGMFSGNKESKVNQTQQYELQSLQIKMADLMEQNHKLTQEIENLKNPTSEDSNIVKLKKA
ncbi:DUF2933 domain-containing protein [Cytobacillus firmus]|uniref:DUF2933 domain-containing protein n=1 Tax=Cytobacillus firmus TaxID=1399 RepID=A0AA46P674_CYTFI|nr:DUF2933 domain-containing protein [Cytobacillus firmus]UYG98066.1 DUF2933 domain-containing protein [Cytobacillus firmus]